MTLVWVFVLTLNLPTFGGPVTATITTADEASCVKLRKVVVDQFGGEKNIKGTVSPCREEKR